ncbi:maleylpyruvate isomerase family mycothiol-dependent enzyme [Rugosimonospora africana]|uniref:TIGR03083 family protein n=1 Tax=Rugosimonospora africana TaxID=556532 RepID=A0A8J3QS97_9ACTN|nr:maleylpyruvate isomerase family mycothiol-dependent enzyme [Rugosimonospora africana]GIH15556.1 hypothetical protein Raf01_37280 [Rugosimonospora africana]
MPTHLSFDRHVDALARAGAVLREAASAAGPDAPVPTCPGWTVTDLVAHQGMVHRWAAAHLRGDADHDATASEREGRRATDPLGWFSQGLTALIDTLAATPEDIKARVFLNDAPPPRRFWARRQAHETTIHSVDAISARLGRWPSAAEADLDSALAADGIDELLTGFITRAKSRLRSAEPYSVVVRADDTGHAWTLRVSDGPVVTIVGETASPEAVFSGSAGQLYLSLWNRADELTAKGRSDIADDWRSRVRVEWG